MLNDNDFAETFICANSLTKVGEFAHMSRETAHDNKISFDGTNQIKTTCCYPTH